jgi:hypothetical protein
MLHGFEHDFRSAIELRREAVRANSRACRARRKAGAPSATVASRSRRTRWRDARAAQLGPEMRGGAFVCRHRVRPAGKPGANVRRARLAAETVERSRFRRRGRLRGAGEAFR